MITGRPLYKGLNGKEKLIIKSSNDIQAKNVNTEY
jgi:hypothetical protein